MNMFGSFLPSLGRQATKFTQVESRHCYDIKWNLLGKYVNAPQEEILRRIGTIRSVSEA